MLEFIIRISILVIILVIGEFLFIKKMSLKPCIKDGLSLGFFTAVILTAVGTNVFHFQSTELIVRIILIILGSTLFFGLFRGESRREGLIEGIVTGIVFVVLSLILAKTMKAIDVFIDLI